MTENVFIKTLEFRILSLQVIKRSLVVLCMALFANSMSIHAQTINLPLVQDAFRNDAFTPGVAVPTLTMVTDYVSEDFSTVTNYVGTSIPPTYYEDLAQAALKFRLPQSGSVLSKAKLFFKVVGIVGSPTATVTLTDDNNWMQTASSTTSKFPALSNPSALLTNAPVSSTGWVYLPLATSALATKIVPTGTTDVTLIITGSTVPHTYFNFVADDDASGNKAYLRITFKPQVQSVTVPANSTYKIGDVLNFVVSFDSLINVTGTPKLPITLNTGGTVQASYVAGSGTQNLVFRYTVASGNLDMDGVTVGNVIALNGGTIISDFGNDAELNLYNIGATAGVRVDGTLPIISSVSPPGNATYIAGQNLDYTVNFSEAVNVIKTSGTPYLTLTIGSTTAHATYISGTGTTAIVFRYTIVSGDYDDDGIALASNITLNGGTIYDVAGNSATLSFTGSTATGVQIGNPPTVTTVAPSDIFSSTATLKGTVNANNASTTVTFEYGLDTNYGTTVTAVESPVTGSSATSVSKAISVLAAGTTYHYRVTGINAGGTANGSDQSFTTPKQSQTITFNALPFKTYGDADFSPEATASSGLTVSCTSSDSNVATIVGCMIHIVGTGTCTIYADQSGNNVYLSAAQASQTLTVTKASLTITADNKNKVYGASLPTLTASYSGFVNGDTSSSLDTPVSLSTTADAASAVGTYTITASNAADANYNITHVNGSLSVTKAALTITADSKTKVYGDVNPALTFNYSGWKNSETETVLDTKPTASTTVTNTTSVGTYTDVITASGGTDNNYSFVYVPANFTVTKAMLTVTANPQSKAFGEANPPITLQYSGWVNGENETVLNTKPTASTTISASTPAGTYEHAITASGGNDKNYDFTYISASFSVKKGTLVIWLDQKTKNYGDENPTLTYHYTGFMNGDDESDLDYIPYPSTSVTRNTNAGTYTSSIGMAGGLDDNYYMVNVPANFIVNKAPLFVKADNKTKVYGQTNPELTVQYSGFMNGDDETVLDTRPTAFTTVDNATSVGNYEITVAGGIDNNYAISTYAPGEMEVTKAALIVTADNKTKVYGDTNPELTFQYSGFMNGDDETVLDTKPTALTTVDNTTGAGIYEITVSGGIDNNYSFRYFAGLFEVTVPKIAGDTNGNGKIDGNEVTGDVNGNGIIDGNEIYGDSNGNGKIDGTETTTGIDHQENIGKLSAWAVRNTEIRLTGQVSKVAIATLYDIQGKVILVANLSEGDLNIIQTPSIRTGVYLLFVKDNKRMESFKILVRE